MGETNIYSTWIGQDQSHGSLFHEFNNCTHTEIGMDSLHALHAFSQFVLYDCVVGHLIITHACRDRLATFWKYFLKAILQSFNTQAITNPKRLHRKTACPTRVEGLQATTRQQSCHRSKMVHLLPAVPYSIHDLTTQGLHLNHCYCRLLSLGGAQRLDNIEHELH